MVRGSGPERVSAGDWGHPAPGRNNGRAPVSHGPMFTQCTHCKSYYRIRAITLRVGQGHVFCTSCRQNFNALERLQEGDPGFPILDAIPVTEPVAAPATDAVPVPDAPAVADTDVTAAIRAPETNQPPAPDADLGPKNAEPEGAQDQVADRWDWEDHWEEAPLGDTAPVSPARAHSAPPLEGDLDGAGTPPLIWVEIPVLEDDAPEPPSRAPAPTPGGAPPGADRATVEPDPGAALEPAAIEPTAGNTADEDAREFIPAALWEDLAPPRLRTHSPVATAAWSAGILLLLATLLGQFVYFQSANLVYYPGLRPWLEPFCHLTGCRVPLPKVLADFDILDRRVYNDPTRKHALVISLIVQNDAAFRQAYPYLQVRFFDLAGQAVALRRFAPGQYLPQGIDPHAGIGPHGSVPVVLEVEDPGQEAVAYDFDFR
ncbi:MAG TPA: DUF3426 domain-containing protein [Gammaproteobacteria bacterium]|nr:DUF3426 domain-containing protein [Gammaproteobacteria bacterium]